MLLLLGLLLLNWVNCCICTNINVGTTLFTTMDYQRECWSQEQLALLTTRMYLEDLMPNMDIWSVISDDIFIDFLDYIKLILVIIKQNTVGADKYITMLAFSDILGGYLNVVVLPIARYAFYSGAINLESITMLYEIFEQLNTLLHTDESGWTTPDSNIVKLVKIPIIRLSFETSETDIEYCENLIIMEDKTKNRTTIPMPFFDNDFDPLAMAIPLTTAPLHNLLSPNSSSILMEYFVCAYKCLVAKRVEPQSIQVFLDEFGDFLKKKVLPLLKNNKFYPTFGGILKISFTLEHLGNKEVKNGIARDDRHIFTFSDQEHPPLQSPQDPMYKMILGLLITAIIVWVIAVTIFLWRRKKKKDHNKKIDGSPGKEKRFSSLGKDDNKKEDEDLRPKKLKKLISIR